nr:MAG TPA: hypothetical protein [Bacteriophage sp.]DAY68829.1 MAG TPA: hypothetical protein [Caudoviricetes sp.]
MSNKLLYLFICNPLPSFHEKKLLTQLISMLSFTKG